MNFEEAIFEASRQKGLTPPDRLTEVTPYLDKHFPLSHKRSWADQTTADTLRLLIEHGYLDLTEMKNDK